jgi:hypothetical protein
MLACWCQHDHSFKLFLSYHSPINQSIILSFLLSLAPLTPALAVRALYTTFEQWYADHPQGFAAADRSAITAGDTSGRQPLTLASRVASGEGVAHLLDGVRLVPGSRRSSINASNRPSIQQPYRDAHQHGNLAISNGGGGGGAGGAQAGTLAAAVAAAVAGAGGRDGTTATTAAAGCKPKQSLEVITTSHESPLPVGPDKKTQHANGVSAAGASAARVSEDSSEALGGKGDKGGQVVSELLGATFLMQISVLWQRAINVRR